MKLLVKIAVLLLLPVSLFAQDAAVVKKQAQVVADAVVNGKYSTVIDYMYPKVVEMSGGKAKLLQLFNTTMAQMKAQGVVFESATVGTPGKFYKAGSEIHCLVPESISMKMGTNKISSHSNLLAISKDGGKNWTFLDLNKNTISAIPKLFPNFNPALKLPQPSQTGM